MGAFKRVNEIQIPRTPEEGAAWGWDAHESVVIKDVFTLGDAEAVANMSAGADGTPSVSMSQVKMLDRMIVRWNFTDDSGNVGVKNELSISQLPMNYVAP